MAIESQGAQVRRQSTAAGSTASVTAATIAFSSGSTNTISRSDAGSFIVDGFTTGMRLETISTVAGFESTNSTRIYTVASVAATVMSVYEPVAAQSTGIALTITGHAMSPIGNVTGFSGPSGSAQVIDVTHLGSTAKEKLIGIRDEGQVSLDILFDTASTSLHNAIRADKQSRTRRIYDIKLTDQSTAAGSQPSAFYFDAYVTNFSITGAIDDAIKGSVTLELSSAVRTIGKV